MEYTYWRSNNLFADTVYRTTGDDVQCWENSIQQWKELDFRFQFISSVVMQINPKTYKHPAFDKIQFYSEVLDGI